MVWANREMAVYCFDTLVAHYNSEQIPPPAFDEAQHPLFVTRKKAMNGSEPSLRGCIGTLEACGLINGFKDYALTSTLWDRCFPLIQANELPNLECTVSVLTNYETALHYLDWEVEKHGIIIEFIDPNYNVTRNATYLPEVAVHEGWTKTEAVDSLMCKAAKMALSPNLLRQNIQLTRYESTLFTMHFNEYIPCVKTTRGVAPNINGANRETFDL